MKFTLSILATSLVIISAVSSIPAPSATSGKQEIKDPFNPCGSFKCAEDLLCVNQRVTCVRAPCYPVPSCVLSVDKIMKEYDPFNPCGQHTCEGNLQCVNQKVDCVHAPCYPIPHCVNA